MKRQLLLQEANNLLLQADITRRETELLRYKHVAKKNPSLKRWNTYGGMEGRVVSDHHCRQSCLLFDEILPVGLTAWENNGRDLLLNEQLTLFHSQSDEIMHWVF